MQLCFLFVLCNFELHCRCPGIERRMIKNGPKSILDDSGIFLLYLSFLTLVYYIWICAIALCQGCFWKAQVFLKVESVILLVALNKMNLIQSFTGFSATKCPISWYFCCFSFPWQWAETESSFSFSFSSSLWYVALGFAYLWQIFDDFW